MDRNSIPFQNVGYALHRFTDEELAPIWQEINDIMNDDTGIHRMNDDLAGNLKFEYELSKTRDYIERLVNPCIWEFNNIFNYPNSLEVLKEAKLLKLDRPWVNLMQKYEYNPIHNHSGVMSFVIWMRVPYTMEEERAAKPYVPAHGNIAGHFALHYVDTLGYIKTETIPVDSSYNNVMCIFPAGMNHSVFPFYSSDDYRITVAGNFIFDLSQGDSEDEGKYNTDAAWVNHEPSPLALSSELNSQQLFTEPVKRAL